MASAVDSRLAYARLSAVATASRLPTATRGSNNSYTTSWDTTGLSVHEDGAQNAIPRTSAMPSGAPISAVTRSTCSIRADDALRPPSGNGRSASNVPERPAEALRSENPVTISVSPRPIFCVT